MRPGLRRSPPKAGRVPVWFPISSASRTVTSGRSANAAFNSSIIVASLMTILAPQSLMIWRICCAFSNALTGTKTPDAMLTPKIDQHSSMPRGR